MINEEFTPEIEQEEEQTDVVEVEEETTQPEEDSTDWKAEALKYKAILDRNKSKKAHSKEEKPKTDELGYDVKAYLKSSGIEASEFDFVKEQMKASGQDVDSLLENAYFQSALKERRELNATKDATPTGTDTNSVATDSVEFWAAKDIEDVPKDMRIKVVNYKLDQEKNKGVFYNS